MENRSYALVAGLFTLLLGIAVLGAFWWFGDKKEEMTQYVVFTNKNVSGLNVQGQVRYRGIRVGKVDFIELDPKNRQYMLIHISIRADTPITNSTYARLGYQGVTGIAYVQLEDTGLDNQLLVASTDESGKAGQARIPMKDSLISELSDMGTETLKNVQDVLKNVNTLLKPDNIERIERILVNLEDTSKNAQVATAQLNNLLSPKNLSLVTSALSKTDKAAGEVAPFIAEARSLVDRLQKTSDRVDLILGESKTGGAAELIDRLNVLSNEFSANSQQLSRVLKMLEESPQSLIFGRDSPLPGPGEAGFVMPSNAENKGKP